MHKFIFLTFLLLLTQNSWAADAQLNGNLPSNVIVVDGKKFFLLNNARRYSPSGNAPSSLLRARAKPAPPTKRADLPLIPSLAPKTNTVFPSTSTPAHTAIDSNTLLSIFEPESHPEALPSTK